LKIRFIERIVTHQGAHLDEILADFLATKMGWNFFHFCKNFDRNFVTSHVSRSVTDSQPNSLFLGVGGGDFDEHGKDDGLACCDLMAQYLEVDRDPRLIKLLETVSFQDRKGCANQNRFNLPRTINLMNRYGYSPEKVRQWVFQAIEAIIESEAMLLRDIEIEVEKDVTNPELRFSEVKTRFFNTQRPWFYLGLEAISELMGEEADTWKVFADKAHEEQRTAFLKAKKEAKKNAVELNTPGGNVCLMVIDGSDGSFIDFEMEFDAVSRVKEISADMVLIRNSKGHTMIGVNRSAKFNLQGLISKIRDAEADARKQEIPKHLKGVEGAPKGFEQWYVHEGINKRRMYSGTLTRPDVDLSILSVETIYELICDWLEVEKTKKEEDNKVSVAPALEGVKVGT
jgi:hypothetical protein